MKILYVLNGSNFSSAGGMEYHLIDITNWLEEKGIDTAKAVRSGTFLHRNFIMRQVKCLPVVLVRFDAMGENHYNFYLNILRSR
jgi:hypothetical protein